MNQATNGEMEERPKCARRRLAERASLKVDACDCGAIHLTIGFITMRLDPHAFREFATMVCEAASHLQSTDRPLMH
jgi:hypothetical protein